LEAISVGVELDFFGNAEEWRDTVINWEQQVQKTVDDYLPFAPIDHAVQKDAIQNCWDARTSRRGRGWGCEIALITDQDGRRVVAITDTGTTGLTGRVLTPAEYYTDMPEEERWARFESLAFTHHAGEESGALGARGQGKFIFVGASKSKQIVYDSLRPDGTYRLGARAVLQTRSPVSHWDDEEALERLGEFHADLWPLQEVGTRVIINDPVDEVVESMVGGRMVQNIADTWWPIISKFGADIRVVTSTPAGNQDTRVEVPDDLLLPTIDSSDAKVWLVENASLDFSGQRYRIKRLHVVHRPNFAVRQEIQGVALIRGGMVVQRLPMRFVPPRVANAITGYVEFDEELDQEMKRAEHPTHYTFDMRRGIGYRVKQWVEDELAKFGNAKLGLGGQSAANAEARRRDAELRALEAINRVAREMGLVGPRGRAGGSRRGNRGGRRTLEPIAVRLDDPVLPRSETRRIDFGEKLSNIRARADNNTSDEAVVRRSIYLTRGDQVVQWIEQNRELTLAPRVQSDWSQATEITFNPDDHPPGVYVLRAKLLVVKSPHRPAMFQHVDAFRFWVAEDPPEGGLFEDVEAIEYPDDLQTIDAEAAPGRAGGHIFQYNLDHPACRRESGSDAEQTDYLFALMARELVVVDLESADPILFDPEQLGSRSDQQRRASRIIGEILYAHYGR
jgi:hypothetical protein